MQYLWYYIYVSKIYVNYVNDFREQWLLLLIYSLIQYRAALKFWAGLLWDLLYLRVYTVKSVFCSFSPPSSALHWGEAITTKLQYADDVSLFEEQYLFLDMLFYRWLYHHAPLKLFPALHRDLLFLSLDGKICIPHLQSTSVCTALTRVNYHDTVVREWCSTLLGS